ncbi:pyridoxal-dependent decarboxylase conserved domain-containing protein [Desarmillaria tabescens]|uniref:Pyridoxal-dependent decarboxylase conserved domain-containing protein n=1 Tax=Armillaria tabescens TaxID=1929756 RepID=A0AA39IYE1_ARMTA|nr:pyridoxal-dependent decarboxylase conserved domain-containing protein [Desarmillaria tabescens]KAK0432104.1 pyridoxal-dependent decarboxylase conserved domain-containing protein [Desarmillaria tabescens]
MDVEQFRKAGYQAIDRICDYYYSLQNKPVVARVPLGHLKAMLPSTPPELGEDFQIIADDYQRLIIPGLTHWQHPSFFAYFPVACTFEGILGDLYSSSVTNPGFNWACSPACTELEVIVMDWAAKLLGLAPKFMNDSGVGGGVIQSTASECAMLTIVAARASYQRSYPDTKLEEFIIYVTSQTHSLGIKAGMVLGLSVRILEVKAEDNYSLRGDTLRSALEQDIEAGKKPLILLATVGTTSSGVIDNLYEIKEVVMDHPYLRIHVDAAWAGVAFSCPEYRQLGYLDEINEFVDCFCTSFYKWGLVNLDASALWVQDRKYLTDALNTTPPYLRTKQDTTIDYRNWHLGLGRRFRSLKLWFVFRSFGIQGFQKHIRKSIGLNNLFVHLVEQSDIIKIVTPPSLSLTVFRLETPSQHRHSLQSLNALNTMLFSRLSLVTIFTLRRQSSMRRFAYVSPSVLNERMRTTYEEPMTPL